MEATEQRVEINQVHDERHMAICIGIYHTIINYEIYDDGSWEENTVVAEENIQTYYMGDDQKLARFKILLQKLGCSVVYVDAFPKDFSDEIKYILDNFQLTHTWILLGAFRTFAKCFDPTCFDRPDLENACSLAKKELCNSELFEEPEIDWIIQKWRRNESINMLQQTITEMNDYNPNDSLHFYKFIEPIAVLFKFFVRCREKKPQNGRPTIKYTLSDN